MALGNTQMFHAKRFAIYKKIFPAPVGRNKPIGTNNAIVFVFFSEEICDDIFVVIIG
jgi:hypothetical protein